jgi:cell division FtsZ-interacting protein ZapD
MFDSTGNLRDPVLARDAIPMLLDLLTEYEPESPRVAQAYFYLTEYRDRDLDQTAIDNMNAYFQVCREQKITLALRFVYVYNQGRDYKQEVVSLEQMLRSVGFYFN